MDSAIIILIITILQNIVDCNGTRLKEQGRQLQTHRTRLNVPDDLRIPRRSNNFYAGMGSLSSPYLPPEKEKEAKLGARMSRIGNSMSITYGGNLDKSEEEDSYSEYRRTIVPQNPKPVLVIALLRAEKRPTSEEDRYRLYMQNDRRSPQLYVRQTRPTFFNFTEQKRAINLMELPIAHYVKDYQKIEMEIQKREAESRQKLQNRNAETGAVILPPTTTNVPVDYLLQSYDRFKEEMMNKEEIIKNQNFMQSQKRFHVIQDDDALVKENILQEYESKQNKLYNNNYESRLPVPPGRYQQASVPSQDYKIQFPRPQIQNAPVSRPQMQDAPVLGPQMQDAPVPGPQIQDAPVPGPQIQDAPVSSPQAPDIILAPKPQAPDPPSIQVQDTESLSQHTVDRQSEDPKFDEVIYNSVPNWQAEAELPNLAALGIKFGEENYNLQEVLDQSSANLADLSIERLVSEYRKLEQEIVRRKDVLENYKKSLKIAQPVLSEQFMKPEYSQNYEFFQPNPSTPSNTPSPPTMPRDPPGLSGMPGPSYPPGPQDSAGPMGQTRPTQRPVVLKELETRLDQHMTCNSNIPRQLTSTSTKMSGKTMTTSTKIPKEFKTTSTKASETTTTKVPQQLTTTSTQAPRQITTTTTKMPWISFLRDLLDNYKETATDDTQPYISDSELAKLYTPQKKQETTTEFSQTYLTDAELATLFNPQKKRFEEVTDGYQFNPDMYSALRNSNRTNVDYNTNARVVGHKPPTGIVTYPNRKSFYEPEFDQLYVIYLQRIRKSKKRRHRRRPIAAYQYAYVDLEHLEDVIKKFRRLRTSPQVLTIRKKIMPTLHDEPAISSDIDDEPLPAQDNGKEDERFRDTGDAFNHIKIDPEAPDMKDFMPKVVFEDLGDKWWFYHQEDYNPFRD